MVEMELMTTATLMWKPSASNSNQITTATASILTLRFLQARCSPFYRKNIRWQSTNGNPDFQWLHLDVRQLGLAWANDSATHSETWRLSVELAALYCLIFCAATTLTAEISLPASSLFSQQSLSCWQRSLSWLFGAYANKPPPAHHQSSDTARF